MSDYPPTPPSEPEGYPPQSAPPGTYPAGPYQQPQTPPPYGQQAYGAAPQMAQPGAPYGIDPVTGLPFSDKQKLVAGLLNIFIAGVGRMYMGQVGLGVAQLAVAIVTCGLGALWSLVDGILILVNGAVDADGRPLRD